MKKYVVGFVCGAVLACSSAALASNSIQALLFPASFEINGNAAPLSRDYKVINVDGHAYVPIRFVAENLGATIDYDNDIGKIYVKNGTLDVTDPDYKGISAGNLILTKSSNNTKVTGQLKMEGVGNSKNRIEAKLDFYNDKGKKIGEVAVKGDKFGVVSETFVTEGLGDFRAYSTVNLRIGAVNNKAVSAAPTIVYENSKYNFTLNLPKDWEGKYEAVEGLNKTSGRESIAFNYTNSNKFGGELFRILVWTQQDWQESAPSMKEIGQIWEVGKRGDRVFILCPPGDVQYDPANAEQTAEYLSMSSHIKTIRTTFKLKD